MSVGTGFAFSEHQETAGRMAGRITGGQQHWRSAKIALAFAKVTGANLQAPASAEPAPAETPTELPRGAVTHFGQGVLRGPTDIAVHEDGTTVFVADAVSKHVLFQHA